jgi:hypothetical protein
MGAEPEPAWMSRLHSAAPNVQPLPYVACNLLHVAAASSKPTVESGTQSQSSTSLLLSRVLGEMDTIMAVSRDDTPKPDSVSNDQDTATMEPLSLLTLDQIVVGIRPLLITHRSNIAAHQHGQALLDGLRRLLSALFEHYGPPTLLLHISSIAAVHHVLPQVQRSVQQIDPPSTQLVEPYDYFKRACEELVESLATSCTSASCLGIFVVANNAQQEYSMDQCTLGSHRFRCHDLHSMQCLVIAMVYRRPLSTDPH